MASDDSYVYDASLLACSAVKNEVGLIEFDQTVVVDNHVELRCNCSADDFGIVPTAGTVIGGGTGLYGSASNPCLAAVHDSVVPHELDSTTGKIIVPRSYSLTLVQGPTCQWLFGSTFNDIASSSPSGSPLSGSYQTFYFKTGSERVCPAPPLIDVDPSAFSFATKTEQAKATLVESGEIVVAGLNEGLEIPVGLSPATSELSVISNGGEASQWFHAADNIKVKNGDRIKLRHTTSSNFGGVVVSTLILGSRLGTFRTETIKNSQVITLTVPSPTQNVGQADQVLTASSSSRLSVEVTATPSNICSIVGGKLHAIASGSCTVKANQGGNTTYLAAPQVQKTVAISKGNQTISFTQSLAIAVGQQDLALTASSSSNLPVAFTTSPSSICSIVAGKLHAIASGSCTVKANQGGNASYNSATEVVKTVVVSKGSQSITFSQPSAMRIGQADLSLTAAAVPSGLTVSFSATPAGVCSIVAGKLHAIAAGSCTVSASQSGNALYNAAPVVNRVVEISVSQSISFTQPAAMVVGDSDLTLRASSTLGLTITFSTSPSRVCSIVSGKLHAIAQGSCIVTAHQAGSSSVHAAADVSRTVAISKGNQTITFAQPGAVAVGNEDLVLNVTSNSQLGVELTTSTPALCSIVSGKLHAIAAGNCVVRANQAGNGSYNAADPVSRTVVISKGNQVITFSQPPAMTVGQSDQTLSVSSNSHLGIALTATPAAVCSIVSGKLHALGAGNCVVKANQAGNASYNAALEVTKTVTISKSPQTITFVTPSAIRVGAVDRALAASSLSGLDVTFTSATPTKCTVVGATGAQKVHAVAAGSCTITASQAGNTAWAAAPSISRTFTVNSAQ